MKALFIFFFLFVSLHAFPQKSKDTILSDALKHKIEAIDEYVISIERSKNLTKQGIEGELTNGGILESYTYIDTVTHERVKSEQIQPDRYVFYLKDNKNVFCREFINISAQVRGTYFENDKIIYSRISQQKILKIMYSRTSGGKDGGYDKFEITPDLIWCETGSRYPQVRHVNTQKNTVENWDELIGEINFLDFNKIKSGKSHMPADGVDYSLTIQTENHFYNITNYSSNDKYYKKMSDFFKKLSLKTDGHYRETN